MDFAWPRHALAALADDGEALLLQRSPSSSNPWPAPTRPSSMFKPPRQVKETTTHLRVLSPTTLNLPCFAPFSFKTTNPTTRTSSFFESEAKRPESESSSAATPTNARLKISLQGSVDRSPTIRATSALCYCKSSSTQALGWRKAGMFKAGVWKGEEDFESAEYKKQATTNLVGNQLFFLQADLGVERVRARSPRHTSWGCMQPAASGVGTGKLNRAVHIKALDSDELPLAKSPHSLASSMSETFVYMHEFDSAGSQKAQLHQQRDPYATIIAARALVEEALIQLDVFASEDDDSEQDLLVKGRRLSARYELVRRKLERDELEGEGDGASHSSHAADRYYAECKKFQEACSKAMQKAEEG
uniref:Uncharacterized protein n=1 Tax=Mycena chlorophos TaxID=658473 RepID=A0ABQ0MCN1_MYCCL|nr:predicted protein [Mycena chlorophos]